MTGKERSIAGNQGLRDPVSSQPAPGTSVENRRQSDPQPQEVQVHDGGWALVT